MRIIILCLFLGIALSGIADVAQTPLPTVIKGTQSKFYLDQKATKTHYFKSVSCPSFVTVSTDGLITSDTKQSGSYPLEIKVYDKDSGQSQSRQYVLKVVDKANDTNIWAYKADSYYSRETAKPFRITLNENTASSVKAGNNFSYSFKTQNGKGDLVYAFIGLPDGIVANRKTGEISGKFAEPGIYTLGCQVADQSGNSAQGFLTITVLSDQLNQLNNVQLPNKVAYKLNLTDIRKQQVAADRQLFDALSVVNAAKAKLAGKQDILKKLKAELDAAEADADKAANNAARAKTERERAAQRLRLTSNALNDAQDNLNLALLEQAAAADAVIVAQDAVAKATQRFNNADVGLKDAQGKVQQAQANLNSCRQNLLKAQNALKNAQKQFDRASQDLSDAKDDLQKALRRKQLGDKDIAKAKDALKLAQQAFNDAQKLLDSANKALADAQNQRQKCLANLADAKYALEQVKNDLGAAQWDLEKALSLLYQAQARKQAADRSSAIALAQGATYNNGSLPLFRSLGGWEKDTSNTGNYIIQAAKDFGECGKSTLPRFAGSAKVTSIQSGVATLSTGQQITFGNCTSGLNNLKPGAQIVVDGVVNVDKKIIQAFAIKEASL